MVISSKENHLVKQWRQLALDGRARRKQGLFACEGARLCEDAALSDVCIEMVLYTEKAAATYAVQLQTIMQAAKAAVMITPQVAQHMADTASPQGIFCTCVLPKSADLSDALTAGGRYLALEELQDPANMGAVIRTGEALGLDGLVLSGNCCDVYSPKVLRASMGGVFRMPLVKLEDTALLVPTLHEKGFTVAACVPDADALPIGKAPIPNGCIPIIGNEGNGLLKQTIVAADARITIPMDGRAESLNAAMAAGIVMWELKRWGDHAD